MANTNQIIQIALHSEKGRAQCRIMPDASFQFESLISYNILPYVISYVGNLYYTLSRTSFAHQILLENVWTFLGPVQHTTWQHSSRHGLFLTDPGMWGRSMRLSMRSKALPTNMKTYLRYTVILLGKEPHFGNCSIGFALDLVCSLNQKRSIKDWPPKKMSRKAQRVLAPRLGRAQPYTRCKANARCKAAHHQPDQTHLVEHKSGLWCSKTVLVRINLVWNGYLFIGGKKYH